MTVSAAPQARQHFVQCLSPAGLHRMAYREWGDPANPKVLVCVHGLTRQSHDFDALAQAMSDEYRVVCPDVVGRGASSWLKNPQFYAVPQYVSDMVTLLARLNAVQVDWFGTSMGGLIGMGLGALPENPIRRMVLNDVGPKIDFAALQRIGSYLGAPVSFATLDEGVAYMNQLAIPFGPHSPAQWQALNSPMLRQRPDGRWEAHYDPAIGVPFKSFTEEQAAQGEAIAWAMFKMIPCEVLTVRGANSDLLSDATQQEMVKVAQRARAVTIPECGHAPSFVQPEQIAVVRDFFLA